MNGEKHLKQNQRPFPQIAEKAAGFIFILVRVKTHRHRLVPIINKK